MNEYCLFSSFFCYKKCKRLLFVSDSRNIRWISLKNVKAKLRRCVYVFLWLHLFLYNILSSICLPACLYSFMVNHITANPFFYQKNENLLCKEGWNINMIIIIRFIASSSHREYQHFYKTFFYLKNIHF